MAINSLDNLGGIMSGGPGAGDTRVTVVELDDDELFASGEKASTPSIRELPERVARAGKGGKDGIGKNHSPDTEVTSGHAQRRTSSLAEPIFVELPEGEQILEPDPQITPSAVGNQHTIKRKNGTLQLFIAGVALILGYLLINDLAVFIIDQFSKSLVLGGITTAILGAGLALCAVSVISEIGSYRRINCIEHPKRLIREAELSKSKSELVRLLTEVCSRLPGLDGGTAAAKFTAQAKNAGEVQDVMTLFEITVMKHLDEAASTKIREASRQAAFFVAISPTSFTVRCSSPSVLFP